MKKTRVGERILDNNNIATRQQVVYSTNLQNAITKSWDSIWKLDEMIDEYPGDLRKQVHTPSLWIDRFESALSLPTSNIVQGTSIKTILSAIHTEYLTLLKDKIPKDIDEKSGAVEVKRTWKTSIDKIASNSTSLYLSHGQSYFLQIAKFATQTFAKDQKKATTGTTNSEQIKLTLQRHAEEMKRINKAKGLNENISAMAFQRMADNTQQTIDQNKKPTSTGKQYSYKDVSGLSAIGGSQKVLDSSFSNILETATNMSHNNPIPSATSSAPHGYRPQNRNPSPHVATSTAPPRQEVINIYYSSDDEMLDDDDPNPIIDLNKLPHPKVLISMAQLSLAVRTQEKARNVKNRASIISFLQTVTQNDDNIVEEMEEYIEVFKKTIDSAKEALTKIEEALEERTNRPGKKRKRYDQLFTVDACETAPKGGLKRDDDEEKQ